MANEATIRGSLAIRAGQTDYQSRPSSFNANVTTPVLGPTPGLVVATAFGVAVNLSLLTTPGLCRIQNLDASNAVELGAYDPDTNEFYPILELLAGESYPLRLSRFLGSEFGTGTTGTTASGSGVQLMLRGLGGTVDCLVEAFSK